MSPWGDTKKTEESPQERDARVSQMIRERSKAPVSPICLAIYGHDGTCKSAACLDVRTPEEIEQHKQVFVIDIDASAAPLHEAYWNKDPDITIFDPNEIDIETGDIDWLGTYDNVKDVARYLRLHEHEMNLKAVVIDGLDTFFKCCEHRMRLKDLKISSTARPDSMFAWGIRNAYFLNVIKLIKGMRCDRLFTTHMRPEKGWETHADGSRTLVIKSWDPYWESTTPNLLSQKLHVERIEEGKI
ncbi:MAG: ATP-binding protein, partial [Gammaproteobacteria bacterium]|nr:ATP-binding protein [Gammaproteobacteria bacterium]